MLIYIHKGQLAPRSWLLTAHECAVIYTSMPLKSQFYIGSRPLRSNLFSVASLNKDMPHTKGKPCVLFHHAIGRPKQHLIFPTSFLIGNGSLLSVSAEG